MAASRASFPGGLQKPVCVFCGSSPGKLPIYAASAEAVGKALAAAKIPLVYGGGRRGLMGVVSQSVLEAGGYAHGIVPQALISRASENTATSSASKPSEAPSGKPSAPQSGEGVGVDLVDSDYDGRLTMSVTGSMHERKTQMAQLSTGGFVVLPGGYGTFEEALEMITWNQLRIHQLPVIILNINNVYTPLRALFETARDAGFIYPENMSLMRIVDLPGGAADNADESKASEWGRAAVEALRDFKFTTGAGYNLSWKNEKEAISSGRDQPVPDPFSLFTTLRFTSSSLASSPMADPDVCKDLIPLVDRHIARLRLARAHLAVKQGEAKWAAWPGDEAVWQALKIKLAEGIRAGGGDWRVRLLLHPHGQVEVQLIPVSATAGLFRLDLPPLRSQPKRALIIDPQSTDLSAESPDALEFRRYKTTNRGMYDVASARAARAGVEVLLHSEGRLLETCTSNIALHLPGAQDEPEWVTPKLSERAVFLAGVVRAELLARGMIREGEVLVEDFERCKLEGRQIVGFNGMVGVWEADLL